MLKIVYLVNNPKYIGTETTFFEKRRKVIEQITKSLSINGTLDFVTIDYGLGRNSDGECRFLKRE